jgi:hypothetical protein
VERVVSGEVGFYQFGAKEVKSCSRMPEIRLQAS